MRPTKTCQTETLLNGASCDLQYCSDCKTVHLILGSMTLHLPEVVFKKLAHDFEKGVLSLKSRTTPSHDLFNKASVTTLHS